MRAESEQIQIPFARSDHCFAPQRDGVLLRAAVVESTLRAAAADLSVAYCASVPGVNAAMMVQDGLAHAEKELAASDGGCPFTHEHLYPKGSMGIMPTKAGHDDKNGPASSTFWQNLGVAASGARLQLVLVVHGHDVVIDAPFGHVALFAAWLPHLTRNDPDGPRGERGDWRLHHTAYVRFGTERVAWVALAHKAAGVRMRVWKTGHANA